MLAQHIARAQPWNFGCYECEIDHGALNESILKINKLRLYCPPDITWSIQVTVLFHKSI
ncbi:hypothetical protein NBY12_24540 (plasmid) [Escherichia coli]|nr:hypothetical protein [Escherichia coli]URV23177.1 hypothetical protein NBY12_24540 [Escherichia coli]